jgi:hypothetical protein
MVSRSRFRRHQVVMLQDRARSFNVVDIHGLAEALPLPVLVVAAAVRTWRRSAALSSVPGGAKWRHIEKAGPMEPLAGSTARGVNASRLKRCCGDSRSAAPCRSRCAPRTSWPAGSRRAKPGSRRDPAQTLVRFDRDQRARCAVAIME